MPFLNLRLLNNVIGLNQLNVVKLHIWQCLLQFFFKGFHVFQGILHKFLIEIKQCFLLPDCVVLADFVNVKLPI